MQKDDIDKWKVGLAMVIDGLQNLFLLYKENVW